MVERARSRDYGKRQRTPGGSSIASYLSGKHFPDYVSLERAVAKAWENSGTHMRGYGHLDFIDDGLRLGLIRETSNGFTLHLPRLEGPQRASSK